MKERQILFTGEMVRAILDGRKTQTRRLVKFPINADSRYVTLTRMQGGFADGVRPVFGAPDEPNWFSVKSPFGTIGDRLWVRETFCYNVRIDEGGPAYWYAATDPEPDACDEDGFTRYRKDGRSASPWIPSIHMPRRASRIDLEITAVRVERVQDITEEDAEKEGCEQASLEHTEDCGDKDCALAGGPHDCCGYLVSARLRFKDLWQSIYANWDANPWVWVYEFRRIKP